jgi:hypothetical protein
LITLKKLGKLITLIVEGSDNDGGGAIFDLDMPDAPIIPQYILNMPDAPTAQLLNRQTQQRKAIGMYK